MALGKFGLGSMTLSLSLSSLVIGTPPGGGGPNTDVIPANTVAPTITGTPQVGQMLAASNGTWTGSPAPTFAYQWYRGTTAISGANGATYVPVSADQGASLAVDVTGSNRAGEKTVRTAATSSIAAAPELKVLVLSSATYRTTDPEGTVIGTITGLTAGSELSLTPNDGRLAISRNGTTAQLVKGLSASGAGSFDITLREALGAAANSPRETIFRLTVTAETGPAQRTAAKRIMVIGDSFGQRAMDVSGQPSRAHAGRVFATATSTTTEAGTLIANGVSYPLASGLALGDDGAAGSIIHTINNTPNRTVFAEPQGGRLRLTSRTRNQPLVITQTVPGLNIPTGTFGPEMTATTAPTANDRFVNPVIKQWPYADTGVGSAINSPGVGGMTWSIANAIQALSGGAYTFPHELNRAIGGSNSGEWKDFSEDEHRLKQAIATADEEHAAGRKIDAVLVHLGINDAQASYGGKNAYDFQKEMIDRWVAKGIPVLLHTVAPCGEPAFPLARISSVKSMGDRRPMIYELNARMIGGTYNGVTYPGFAAEPSLAGMVAVANITDVLRDPNAAQDFDILPAYAYDGLHLSPAGCFVAAEKLLAALNSLLPQVVVPPLASVENAGNVLGSKGLMAGTGGTLTRTGAASNNAGFTMTGTVPAGWLVATSNGWSGADPANVKGTLTVSKAAADVGEAIVVEAVLNGSGRSNADGVALEISSDIDMTQFAAGDYIEALARLNLSGLAGFRAADLKLVLTEPDGVTRILRTHNPPSAAMCPKPDWPQNDRNMVLRSSRRRVKSGAYGTSKLVITLWLSGNAADIRFVAKLMQAAVRKAPFPN